MCYLDHRLITLLLEPHTASSCRSLHSVPSILPSLSHLFYHQADNAAGFSAWHSTSLPMSCLPVSFSLSTLFLSLSPPPSPSSVLVSLITIQQTAAVESAERWHTIPQSWNVQTHHLSLSPPPPFSVSSRLYSQLVTLPVPEHTLAIVYPFLIG